MSTLETSRGIGLPAVERVFLTLCFLFPGPGMISWSRQGLSGHCEGQVTSEPAVNAKLFYLIRTRADLVTRTAIYAIAPELSAAASPWDDSHFTCHCQM